MEPLAGFMMGLAGSLHCAGMCGPIAMALPKMSTHTSHFIVGRVLYQLGRIASYMVLGLIAGLGTSVIALAGYERIISIVAGVLMVIVAMMQILWHRSVIPSGPITRWTAPVRTSMTRLLQRDSLFALWGLGVVNGLLPCGLVVAAVLGSASTISLVDGAMFMAFFGMGTLPIMTTFSLGGGWIASALKGKVRLAMPIVALLLGTAFMVRGMGLGIPYLSPKPPAQIIHTTECHCH